MGNTSSQESSTPYDKSVSTISIAHRSKGVTEVAKAPSHIKRDQIHLLRRMFSKLDPAVVKDDQDVNYGQLKLAIKYVSHHQLLLVKVYNARYLTAKSVRGQISKPFVKVELVKTGSSESTDFLKSPENAAKFTSSVQQTNNLVFNEIFSFKLSERCFKDVKLRCSVWSSDGLEEDEFFGEIYFDISELDCVDTIRTNWHDLQPQTDITIGGDIELHLGYKLPQSLTVTINSARNLTKLVKDDRTPALSVKVVVPGAPYVFKSTPVRGEDEYTWIETFTLPIPREELTSRQLVLVVSDTKEDDSYLGECHIDLGSLDLLRGYEGTFHLSDMRGSNTVRSRWTQNAITQELQEALYAHSVYMRPQLIFDNNSASTKAVSVSVPKAFVHSHMRVVNGVVVQ